MGGDGDQFVFDTSTVLGKQMEKTLDWLDEADFETTVTCCGENGPEEKQCGGGPDKPSCKTICGEVTRYRYAFDEFDNTQCSADLFYRNTDIWKLDDVCPAPKTWVPYVAPEYSTYSNQNLPSYIRGKRASTECEIMDPKKKKGCATKGKNMSLDVSGCKARKAYTKGRIGGDNGICCIHPNFRNNAINQITEAGGSTEAGRANFQETKKECCSSYKKQINGTDALQKLCRF